MVKIVTRSKIYKRVDRHSRMAEERKARMAAYKSTAKEDLANTCEETFIELPRSMRKVDDDGDNGGAAVEKDAGSGLPMIRKDAVKEKFNQLRFLDGNTDMLDKRDGGADHHHHGIGHHERDEAEPYDAKYVAPRSRLMQKDDCTVRVTNLSEETEEDDLEELFGRIGKISRIYLAKDKDTKSSKGFAFITYDDRHTAEKAIRSLDRHGYDSLLLKVEWAKPSVKGRD